MAANWSSAASASSSAHSRRSSGLVGLASLACTIGPTLRGLRYETTAIPEICDQAATLATRLTTMPRLVTTS